jgi:hypothetical protein
MVNVHPNLTVWEKGVGIARPSTAPLASETISRQNFRSRSRCDAMLGGRCSLQSF